MDNNLLEIKSLNGNVYVYNYKYNLIQPKILYDNEKVEIMAKEYIATMQEISAYHFIHRDINEKYRLLCLVLTDDCNFRCKYCANSSMYKYSKGYSHKSMSYEIILIEHYSFIMKNI